MNPLRNDPAQPRKYNHLFFDLDHTLWDFEANARETLHDLYISQGLANRGVPVFEPFFERYSYHNERLWDRYTKGFIRQEELRWKRMWLTLLDYKIADEPLSKELAVRFLEILPTKKNLFPYTREILSYLRNRGYTMHLITNGFESVQHKKLGNSDLSGFFAEVITSEASNSLKPNPEIFEYAIRKSGASLEESIMIGDNLDADIQGGINAGMDTIFVNHLHITPHIHATYEIRHLEELEALL